MRNLDAVGVHIDIKNRSSVPLTSTVGRRIQLTTADAVGSATCLSAFTPPLYSVSVCLADEQFVEREASGVDVSMLLRLSLPSLCFRCPSSDCILTFIEH